MSRQGNFFDSIKHIVDVKSCLLEMDKQHCIRYFCVQTISIDNIHSGKLANSDLK